MSYQRERKKVVDNISIDATFHKYDPDWNDYVDLSNETNDCILEAKEKLKAVITPRIVTPCSVLNDSVSLSAQWLPY